MLCIQFFKVRKLIEEAVKLHIINTFVAAIVYLEEVCHDRFDPSVAYSLIRYHLLEEYPYMIFRSKKLPLLIKSLKDFKDWLTRHYHPTLNRLKNFKFQCSCKFQCPVLHLVRRLQVNLQLLKRQVQWFVLFRLASFFELVFINILSYNFILLILILILIQVFLNLLFNLFWHLGCYDLYTW